MNYSAIPSNSATAQPQFDWGCFLTGDEARQLEAAAAGVEVLGELDELDELEELDDESLELAVFSELDELDDDESALTELFAASRLSVR